MVRNYWSLSWLHLPNLCCKRNSTNTMKQSNQIKAAVRILKSRKRNKDVVEKIYHDGSMSGDKGKGFEVRSTLVLGLRLQTYPALLFLLFLCVPKINPKNIHQISPIFLNPEKGKKNKKQKTKSINMKMTQSCVLVSIISLHYKS